MYERGISMKKHPTLNGPDEITGQNMKKRIKNLFTETDPPSYASIREVDAMKARINELEAELALQPKVEARATGLDQAVRAELVPAQPRVTKSQAQPTRTTRLPRFLSAPVFEGDAEKTQSAKLLYQIITVIWILPTLLVTIGILGNR